MPTVRVSDPSKTKAVVQRAFYLAFLAAGAAVGMGVLQDRGGVTEEQVWKNVATRGDYGGGLIPGMDDASKGKAYGDYVFGRMLKLRIEFNESEGTITFTDSAPQADYQGWSSGKPRVAADVPRTPGEKYPTYAALIEHAASQIGVTLERTGAVVV